jgi:hypothetical protein
VDDDLILYNLLNALTSAGEKLAPEIKKDVEAIMAAHEAANEVNSTGGRTRKAHQWLQRLRNPFFTTRHTKAAKQANNKLLKRTQAAFSKSLSQTVIAYCLHRQAILEQSILTDSDCGPPSREGVPVKDWDDLQRFATSMEDRNVARFKLGRLRNHESDFIAQLAADAHRDPNYQEKDNVWNLVLHSGVFAAFRKNMSEDELTLLAEAAARRHSPEALAMRDNLEARLGRRLDVTPEFAEACESLLSKVDEWTTTGEANAIREARGGQWSMQTEYLCKLLSVPIEKKAQIDVFVGFLVSAMRENRERDNYWDYLRYNLEEFTKTFERRQISPAAWLPGLAEVFGVGQNFKARKFTDPAAFWALYEFVLRNSETYKRLTKEEHDASENEHRKFRQFESEYLIAMGINHTVDEEGRAIWDPSLDDDEDAEFDEPLEFDMLDAQVSEAASELPEAPVIYAHDQVPNSTTLSVPEKPNPVLFGEILTTPQQNNGKYGDLE